MNRNDYDKIIDKAKDIQKEWRTIPAPRRGDLIRVFGNELQDYKISRSSCKYEVFTRGS